MRPECFPDAGTPFALDRGTARRTKHTIRRAVNAAPGYSLKATPLKDATPVAPDVATCFKSP
jgi:hypothetical protein